MFDWFFDLFRDDDVSPLDADFYAEEDAFADEMICRGPGFSAVADLMDSDF